jgi:hypothetical protein
LSVEDTLLRRLAQGVEDVAAARGECIQDEPAVVRPRSLARHRDVPAADQPHRRDRLRRRATRAYRHHRCTGAGEAGDAVEARGLEGFRQGHLRQAGGETACQPRRARPKGVQEESVMATMPASASVSRVIL